MLDLFKEVFKFMKAHKKWWLLPLLLFLILFSALVVYSQGSAVSPFVYSFF